MWVIAHPSRNTLRIAPEKGSHARILKILNKLAAMLNALPKMSDKVFEVTVDAMIKSFARQRRRLANKLQNPRLLQITFHTVRHWKATMEYAKTRDILHVMRILGHKSIQNTLIYIHLVDFKEDEYIAKVAKTENEVCKLIEAGFEYVCTATDGVMLFRKRK
ncbi:MAG: tyrosine-type recombinase/integrase [Candidatus Bathycorpusculaceae bacterium]